MTETEFDLGNFPKEEANEFDDEVINDLLGAIEVLEERGWTGKGWSSGKRLCILNAVTAAENGGVPQHHYTDIPGKVLSYIHKAIHPDRELPITKNAPDGVEDPYNRTVMAGNIMQWNDGSGFKRRGPIVEALRKAAELRKKDLGKS